ncbi:hypothetical protein GCM10022237_39650 [Nocardioides ginsengisoli]|uniref:DUF4031 domain-containing protein n=1 Tax=Kribbella ginsengisoli TaxID=363865 RepID=A0ABP6Z8K7_9ACTN
MTVYVDDMRRKARVGNIDARWSHLFADTSQELVAFGAQLGLLPSWLQHAGTYREHFDVTDSKRTAALAAGAVAVAYPRGTAGLLDTKRQDHAGKEIDR